jgi:hypothetical protein
MAEDYPICVILKLWGMFVLCILQSADYYGIIIFGLNNLHAKGIPNSKKIYRPICVEIIPVLAGTGFRNWRF